MSTPPQKLTVTEKLSYGIGDVANGLAVASVGFWLLFYLTKTAGISPVWAGTALMIGRAWDAFTDPVMGWIIDRTRTRWGKRRPYLLFGAIPYALSFASMWMVPDLETEFSRFVYVTLSLILFNTAFTVIFIPYTSLTAAMTSDYDDRTSLTGYRMVCSQVAFLVGAALPSFLVTWITSPEGYSVAASLGLNAPFGSWANTARQGYVLFALLFAAIMAAAIWITFFGVRERIEAEANRDVANHPFTYMQGLVSVFRTSYLYRSAVMMKLLSTCAATLIGAKLPFFIEYVIKMPDAKTEIIIVLFVTAIFSTPVWVKITEKLGKVQAFRVGMAGYIVILLSLYFLGSEPTIFIYPLAVLAGFFHAAALLIPWTMIPDVIEHDELENGRRREGLLYGGTTFAYKMASALAVFLAGAGLDAIGYSPSVPQSQETILGMMHLIAASPAILLVLSIVASRRYDLSRERHHEIVQKLEASKEKL